MGETFTDILGFARAILKQSDFDKLFGFQSSVDFLEEARVDIGFTEELTLGAVVG